jgi:hypothetical protein
VKNSQVQTQTTQKLSSPAVAGEELANTPAPPAKKKTQTTQNLSLSLVCSE